MPIAVAVGLALVLAGCGDPLPGSWPPGTFCGLDEPSKETGDGGTGGDGGDTSRTSGADGSAPETGTWTGAIVNGQPAPDPSVVTLSEGQKLAVGAMVGSGGGNFCTGTLVGDNAVLTAAHCMLGWSPDDAGFAIGPDASRPLHVFRFSEIHVNPLFAGDAPHDSTVCILRGLASDEYPDVAPIDFNRDALEDLSPAFIGRSVQNGGYGSTEPRGGGSNTRMWWTVEEAIALDGTTYSVDGHGVSAVCFGDSGSPTLMSFPDGSIRTIGTLHGGDPSCVGIDRFARTDADAAWIDSFVVPAAGCRLGTVGRCRDGVAEWCVGEEEGDLRTTDCSALRRPCGRDPEGNQRCLPGEMCPPDLSWLGRCDEGDVAVWCEGGLVRRRHCRPCGQVCRRVDAAIGFYCAEPLSE